MSKVKRLVGKLDFSASMESRILKKRKSYVEWIILFCILAFSAVIFLYMDMLNTFDNSVLFLKALFSGNFLNFYDYTIQNAGTNYAANYEILIYVIYGIWNLPIFLLSSIFHVDYVGSAWCLIWCKTFGIICSVLIGITVYKILKLIGAKEEHRALGFFLTMSSMALFLVAFVVAQVDEIGLLLILLGFYYYLKGNDRKNQIKFLLFFMLAMPLKTFAVFIMIPLIALREKRIIPLIGKIASGFILFFVCKLLFVGDPAYKFALSAQSRDATEQLISGTMEAGTKIVLFVGLYLAICIFCFVHKVKDEEKFTAPIYISFLVWAAFFCTVLINTYWIIFIAPFSVLAIIASGKYMNVAVLLDSVAGIAFALFVGFKNNVLSEKGLATRLFLTKFIHVSQRSQLKYGSLKNFAEAVGLDKFDYIFNTIFVVCIAAMVILLNPWINKKAKRFEHIERGAIWLRLAFIGGLSALLLFVNILPQAPVQYTTMDSNAASTEVNLVDVDQRNAFTQDITFDNDASLSELTLKIYNNDSYRRNFTSVLFEITDKATGETLYSYREGSSMISDEKEEHTIKLKGTKVESGRTYTLKISGILGIEGNNNPFDTKGGMSEYEVCPYRTEGLVDTEHPAYLNGEKQNYNLCFEIR